MIKNKHFSDLDHNTNLLTLTYVRNITLQVQIASLSLMLTLTFWQLEGFVGGKL